MFKLFKSNKALGSTPRLSKRQPWLWTKEGDRESFFELNTQGQVVSPTHQTQQPWVDNANVDVISFSKDDDWEIKAESRESEAAMKKRLMADVGVRILAWPQALKTEAAAGFSLTDLKRLAGHLLEKNPASPFVDKTLSDVGVQGNWLYATPEERMRSIPVKARVWSGLSLVRYLLDQAFKSVVQPETPFVTGVVFSGSPTTVIVFLKCDANGLFSAPQVVRHADLSADGFSSACANYAELVRLGRDLPQERIKLFDGAHAMELIASKTKPSQIGSIRALVRAYPSEAEVLGVRHSNWLRFGLYASALALAVDLVVGFSAMGLASVSNAENQQLQETLTRQDQARKQASQQRFKTLIELGSVPIGRLITEARSMYRDGIRLEIDASRAKTTYRISRRFQDEASQPSAMADLVQIKVPESCQRSAPETTLQLNEVFVYVECQTTDPYLARVLGAGT